MGSNLIFNNNYIIKPIKFIFYARELLWARNECITSILLV